MQGEADTAKSLLPMPTGSNERPEDPGILIGLLPFSEHMDSKLDRIDGLCCSHAVDLGRIAFER